MMLLSEYRINCFQYFFIIDFSSKSLSYLYFEKPELDLWPKQISHFLFQTLFLDKLNFIINSSKIW